MSLSLDGSRLYAAWLPRRVVVALRGCRDFHHGLLGLAPGLETGHLRLAPHHRIRSDDGLLTLLKFDQSYRQIPVFGADAVITLIATKRGVTGIRGAIVDARQVFAHVDAPSSPAQAMAGLLARTAEFLQVPPDTLSITDLRLVAFPRLRKIGWAAEVSRGIFSSGTAVIEADPAPAGAFPPLLYFDSPVGQGLADLTPVEVRADDPATNPSDGVLEPLDRTTLYDGSPLQGSINSGPTFALATERVFAVDGTPLAAPNEFRQTPAFTSPTMQFLASPGTPEFRVQYTFALASDMYARTDLIMAGKWDSALGAKSLFPPDQFSPRVAVWVNAPDTTCEYLGSPDGVAYCAGGLQNLSGNGPGALSDEYEQPLNGVIVDGKVTYESLGSLTLEGFSTPAVTAHEFGHVVDFFATSGVLDRGFGCKNCRASCEPGSTDEVGALMESWAQFASMWYLGELYKLGAQSSICAIPKDVSRGINDAAHSDTCRPDGEPYSLFLRPDDPGCPGNTEDLKSSICDRPGPEDADSNTGLCLRNKGYRIDSFFNPLWELLRAETCAVDPPYVCTSLPTLAALPTGDVIGRALIFALRVNSATYKGFADDMGLYVACNHGPDAFAELNEVFCHHFLQECGQAPPIGCCGNGGRENAEDCDGDDLGGFTCADVGFDGGTLACTADCDLDVTQCVHDTPTTGDSETSVTTVATATDTPTGPGPATTGAESLTDEGGGEGGETGGGCSCGTRGDTAPGGWMLAAGALTLLRRSRRWLTCALALASLPVINACGPSIGNGESTDDPTAVSTAMPSTASTGAASSTSTGEVPQTFRRFGTFHRETNTVPFQSPPDIIFFPWMTLEIREDGTLDEIVHDCTSLAHVHPFAWENIGEGAIRVVPATLSAEGTFLWSADQVEAVTISPGEGCDDIMVLIEYTAESEKADLLHRFVPGALCTEGTMCDFSFVWCDGQEPAPCE